MKPTPSRWEWPPLKGGEIAPPEDYAYPDPNVLMDEMIAAANKVEALTIGYNSNELLMGDFLDSLIEDREIPFRAEDSFTLLVDQELMAETLTEELGTIVNTFQSRFLPSVFERLILKIPLFTVDGIVASDVRLIARSIDAGRGEFELPFRAIMPLSTTDLKAIYKVVQGKEEQDFAKWIQGDVRLAPWREDKSLPGREGHEEEEKQLREQYDEAGWAQTNHPPGMDTIWQQVFNTWTNRGYSKAETRWRKKAIEFTEDLAVYMQALLNNYGLQEAKVEIARTEMARDDLVEFMGGFVYHFGFPRSRWFSHEVEPGEPRENQWYSFEGGRPQMQYVPRTKVSYLDKVWKELGKLPDYKGGGDPDENFIFVEFSSSLQGWL
tara:strand:+ start:420 stop:1559 length:1140 start_codon:yes stop_codon:yes gene_type:complete